MPINLKTLTEFVRQTWGKFLSVLPSIDPTIDASLGRASSIASAAAGVSLQEGLKDAVEQMFWQTADDDYLELIGSYDQTYRFDPQASSGYCAVNGILTTVIPVDSELTSNGLTYKVLQESTVQNYTDSIDLSYLAGIVTAETTAEHSLSSGIEVTISGATQTDYNGTFTIVVLDKYTFTYELEAGTLSEDSGSYSSDYALLNIECLSTGQITNLSAGAQLSINIIDIDDTAYVGVDGISNGFDIENIEAYRIRVGESHSITPGINTKPQLIFSAKSYTGNTRVFVISPAYGFTGIGTRGEAGYRPLVGETVMYILRDNDDPITPTQQELDDTKDIILADNIWATFVPEENLFVLAPILIEEDFTFSFINPDTTEMRNAIRNQLTTFFQDNASVGAPEFTITLKSINTFLDQVQDSTGAILSNYVLVSPAIDLVATSGEIYTRGDVVFP